MSAPAARQFVGPLAIMAGLLVISIQPARGQSSSSVIGNEVLSRARPGVDPVGLRLGGFRLFPMMTGTVGYDDNIYNVDRDTRKSAVLSIGPSLQAQSDWNIHQLTLNAQALIERYRGLRTENNNQYSASLAGRLDITRAIGINGDAHARHAIEARGTAGDVLTRGEPIRYDAAGGTVTIQRDFGALLTQVGGTFDRFSYEDARVGSQTIDQSYRDRDSATLTGRLGYHLSPGLTAFVQGSRRWERYDTRLASASLDSNESTVVGGVRFAITRLVSGEVGVGYLRRRYPLRRAEVTSGLAYDFTVIWNPTTLVSISARARRSIEESPTLLASGIGTAQSSVDLDYEPVRRILIKARLARVREKYRGVDRRDRRTEARVGVRYLMNRFAEVGLFYERQRQRGGGAGGRSYRGNKVGLTVTVQR